MKRYLREVAQITRGVPKGRLEDTRDQSMGVAVVQPTNLGPLGLEGEFSVATMANYKMDAYRLRGGEVLISLLDPPDAPLRVGVVNFSPPIFVANGYRELVAGANVAIIRPNTDQIDAGFLATYLRSQAAAAQLRAFRGGSVQSYLNIAALGQVQIPTPPLEEQRNVAHVHEDYERYALETQRLLHVERELIQARFIDWLGRTGE